MMRPLQYCAHWSCGYIHKIWVQLSLPAFHQEGLTGDSSLCYVEKTKPKTNNKEPYRETDKRVISLIQSSSNRYFAVEREDKLTKETTEAGEMAQLL